MWQDSVKLNREAWIHGTWSYVCSDNRGIRRRYLIYGTCSYVMLGRSQAESGSRDSWHVELSCGRALSRREMGNGGI